MTTTGATPELTDIFGHEQIARMAALQGVASFAKGMFGTTNPGVLIELADYVIGDDEPFDPVALARKARAAIAAERGYYDEDEAGAEQGYCYEDGPMADWERELLALEEVVVGDITVSDLAGFLTLPTTAILEDQDGDTWRYEDGGWIYGGYDIPRHPVQIFADLAYFTGRFDFIVTNPEVLS